ncbi:MAG: hypothetical protein EPO65_01345 [Dehalococcoidia bacterium]|nr:MAG: hypothetical protein EPO65_01345 [Dehalococcoidia bacterium]
MDRQSRPTSKADHSAEDAASAQPALHLVGDPARPTCVHHWVLGDPANGEVVGRCKRCGAGRVFSSTPEGTFRFDDFRELTQSSTYFERSKQTA